MKFLREPLLHFLVIGTAIFLLYGMMPPEEAQDKERTITITAGEIDWLTDSWAKRWHRPPTVEEREGLIKHYLREMILYREAVAMGLDRDDVVIRRRLAQKLEFLTQDLISPEPPKAEQLQAYFEANIQRYQQPDRITLTHVYFDPDKRGDHILVDVGHQKEKLQALKQPPRDTHAFGDRLIGLPSDFLERSQTELAKPFGRGFAQAVFELAPRQWHGPVLSGYGVHLVYVHDRRKAQPPKFAALQEQVRQDWENDRREQLNEQFVASLIARYKVTIEDVARDEKTGAQKEQTQ